MLIDDNNSISSRPKQRLQNYYDVLGVSIHASDTEIREAYFRLKNTYNRTNQALYSLVDHSEIDELSRNLQIAYDTLSNLKSRMSYNDSMGIELQINRNEPLYQKQKRAGAYTAQSERILYARELQASLDERSSHDHLENAVKKVESKPAPVPQKGRILRAIAQAKDPVYQNELQLLIEKSDLSSGIFFKSLRQISNTELDDVQFHTKVAKSFILAIEEEQYDFLPQASYVRGFLKSYLVFLGVDKNSEIIDQFIGKYEDWKQKEI